VTLETFGSQKEDINKTNKKRYVYNLMELKDFYELGLVSYLSTAVIL